MNDEPNRIWSRIVDFLTDDERQMADNEVTIELARRGLPVAPALDRVLLAARVQRAKARLEVVRQKRFACLQQLHQTSRAIAADLYETIHQLIERQTSISMRAAYFRRLDGAASESDLNQLLADLQQLDKWSESDDGAMDSFSHKIGSMTDASRAANKTFPPGISPQGSP